MKKSKTLWLLLTLALTLGLAMACVGCGGGNNKPSGGPGGDAVITVTGTIPETGKMGKLVTVPAATAVDGDGSNLTDSVIVNVVGYDALDEEKAWPLYDQPAATAQTFRPTKWTKWTIVYSVVGKNGNLVFVKYDFTAEADNTPPELVVSSDAAISVTAGETITLPTATATDDGDNISDDIEVRLYAGATGNTLLTTYKTRGKAHDITLTHGSYHAVYGVSDGAGNKATETKIQIEVSKAPYAQELLAKSAMVTPVNTTWAGNELQIGVTSGSTDKNQACASVTTDKVGKDDIVGIVLQIDEHAAEGGESMYHLGYYASKDNDALMPSGYESIWPNAFFVRIGASYTGLYSSKKNDNVAKQSSKIALMDGRTHKIYLQVTTTGDSATATDASIVYKMWLDVAPDAESGIVSVADDPVRGNYFEITVLPGDENGNHGSAVEHMAPEDFATYYNNAEGWLYFGSVCDLPSGTTPADDKMTIKSVRLYDKNATDYQLNIPRIDIDTSSIAKRQEIPTPLALPSYTWDANAASHTLRVELPNGETDTIANDATSYTFTQAGAHTVVWQASNADGISVEHKVKVNVYTALSEFGLPFPEIKDTVTPGEGPWTGLRPASSGSYNILEGLADGSGNGKYIAVEFKLNKIERVEQGLYGVQTTGGAKLSSWMAGSGINITQRNGQIYVCLNGKQQEEAIGVAKNVMTSEFFEWQQDDTYSTHFFLVYKLDYVKNDAGLLKAIEIRVWIGTAPSNLTQLSFEKEALSTIFDGATLDAIVADPQKLVLTAEMLDDKDASAYTYGQAAGLNAYFTQEGGAESTLDVCSLNVYDDLPEQVAAPTVEIDGTEFGKRHTAGNAVTLPVPNWNDAATTKTLVVTKPDGTDETADLSAQTYTFETPGVYVFTYTGVNSANVKVVRRFKVNVYDPNEEYTVEMPANIATAPEAASGVPLTGLKSVYPQNDAVVTTLATGSGNGKYVAVQFRLNDYEKDDANIALQILGDGKISAWGEGAGTINLAVKSGSVYVCVNGRDDRFAIAYAENKALGYRDGAVTNYYLVYQVKYIPGKTEGLRAVEIRVWIGAALTDLKPLTFTASARGGDYKLDWTTAECESVFAGGTVLRLEAELLGEKKLSSHIGQGAGVNVKYVQNAATATTLDIPSVQLLDELPEHIDPAAIDLDETAFEGRFKTGDTLTLPTPTITGAETSSLVITLPDATVTEDMLAETSYTFTQTGEYVFTYTATNAANVSAVKVIRITVYDATAEFTVEMPANIVSAPEVASGVPFTGLKSAYPQNDAAVTTVASGSGNGKYVAVKYKINDYEGDQPNLSLQILGNTEIGSWGSGTDVINLAVHAGHVCVCLNGREYGDAVAFAYNKALGYRDGGTTEFYLVYKVDYVLGEDGVGLKAVEIRVWIGTALTKLEQLTFAHNGGIGGKLSWTEAERETTVKDDRTVVRFGAELIHEKNLGESIGQGAGVNVKYVQNASDNTTLDIPDVKILDELPIEYIANESGDMTSVNNAGVNVKILNNSAIGKYVTVKLSLIGVTGFDRFGMQILGDTPTSVYNTGGITLAFFDDGNRFVALGSKGELDGSFFYSSVKNACVETENADDPAKKDITFYITYHLSYRYAVDKSVESITFELWAGADLDSMSKLSWNDWASFGADYTDKTAPVFTPALLEARGLTESDRSVGSTWLTFKSNSLGKASFADVQVTDSIWDVLPVVANKSGGKGAANGGDGTVVQILHDSAVGKDVTMKWTIENYSNKFTGGIQLLGTESPDVFAGNNKGLSLYLVNDCLAIMSNKNYQAQNFGGLTTNYYISQFNGQLDGTTLTLWVRYRITALDDGGFTVKLWLGKTQDTLKAITFGDGLMAGLTDEQKAALLPGDKQTLTVSKECIDAFGWTEANYGSGKTVLLCVAGDTGVRIDFSDVTVTAPSASAAA